MKHDMPPLKTRPEDLLAAAGFGSWEYDHQADRLLVDVGFLTAIGVAPELADGSRASWHEAIHPEDRAAFRAEWLAAYAAGPPHVMQTEYRLRRQDGGWSWLLARGRIQACDAAGRALRSAGLVADIGERKHAELLLQIQHEFSGQLLADPDRAGLARAILASALRMPDLDGGGIYLRRDDGGFDLVADQGLSAGFVARVAHLGADSPQAAIIRNGRLLCSCADAGAACTTPELVREPAVAAEGIRCLVVLPIVVTGEALACLNLASHGGAAISRATLTGLETLARQFAQALARMQAAEQAEHRRGNLDGLFDAIADYLFVLDLDGTILHYNRAVADGLGWGDSLVGRPVAEIHPADRRAEAARIVATMVAGSITSCPLPLLRADGQRVTVDTRAVAGRWNGKPAIIGVSRDIAVQLKQEQELGEAKQFSDDLIRALPGIYFLIDQDGRMVRWNGILRDITGLDDQAIGAMRAIEFFAGDDVGRISGAVAEAFLKGAVSVEANLLTRFGHGVPYLFSARRTSIGGRDFIGGFGVDVSAMKLAERVVAEESERRRVLFEQANDGIVIADLKGRVVEANAAFAAMLGYSAEEMRHLSIADWEIRPREELVAEFAGFAGGSRTFETRHRRKDGSIIDIEVSVNAIESNGETLLVGAHRDITPRKAATAALREREEIYGAIVSRSQEGLLLVDVESLEFVEFNDAACEGLGYSREEFARLTLPDVQGILTPEETREKTAFAATRADGIRFENRHRCKDGSLRDRSISNRPVIVGGRVCLAHVWHDITEERRAARALQDSAMFLRETQAISHVGGWKANPETDMLLWTEEVYRLVGHPLDRPPAGLADGLRYYAPEYLPEIRRLLGESWASGAPFTFETEMVAASGRRFWAELRCVGRIESDEGTYLTGTFQDITAQKAAKQALLAREQILSAIVGQAADGIELSDHESFRYVEFNDACCRMLGYTREEYGKLTVFDVQADLSEAQVRELVGRMPLGEAVSFENRHRRKDGTALDVQVSARVIDIGGRRHVLGIWRDISEAKAIAAELDRHRHHLEDLVAERTAALEEANHRLAMNDRRLTAMFAMSQKAPDMDEGDLLRLGLEEAVRLTDSAIGYLHFLNADQETITLFTWSAATLQHCTAVHDSHYPVSSAGIWADTVRLRRAVIHNDYQGLDGRQGYPAGHAHLVRHLGVPILDRGVVTLLLGVGNKPTDYDDSDVNELQLIGNDLWSIVMRRRAEVALAEAKKAAEAASVAKSAFLANMSHEIRTPMNGIVGMANILRRGGVTPQQSEQLDKIDTAAEHLLGIINDILDISKIEAGKFVLEEAPVAVGAVVENVVAMITERARAKGVDVRLTLDAVPDDLVGDATRLQQALLNYATNAVKFTEKGRVTLRVTQVEQSANHARLRFEVEDSGIGIPPGTLSRLFSAFEQADSSTTRRHGGTGLGLAITRHLAELMGGSAGATSTVGTGSTFWFTARLRRSGAERGMPKEPSAGNAEASLREQFRGSRILVVDDEPINREVARMLLEDVGLAVETADDGAAAVARARRERFAAILMDMQMPELDGIAATREIRANSVAPRVPIIAMTANAFAEDRARCLAAGMDDYLAKPFEPDTLFAVLLEWLGKSRSA